MKDFTEDKWISWLKKNVKVPKQVTRAIGEDCAVIKLDNKKSLLVTSDMLVEDVHFKLNEATLRQVGYKAAAVSLSDIASMSGRPKWATVSVGAPKNISGKELKEVFAGLNKALNAHDAALIGGDSNSSSKFVIDVTLIGEVDNRQITGRDGGKDNDLLLVTGKLGGSYASKRHLKFIPRVSEAQYLKKHFTVNSMIDISDGLAQDLRRLSAESGIGALMYESLIPAHRGADINNALYDGEDFELLFSVPAKDFSEKKAAEFAGKFKLPLTVIGSLTKKHKAVYIVDSKNRKKRLLNKSFQHFT